MNILVTLDENYLQPLCVMLRSLAKVYPTQEIHLYVAHSALTAADFLRLQTAASAHTTLHSLPLAEDFLQNAPLLKRISRETYFRLFAPVYLPEAVDRILYIDPDTLILKDFSALYKTDFKDNLYIGAGHLSPFANFINTERLHIPKQYPYINAGVLLMNLKALRREFQEKIIFNYIRKNGKQLCLADQDVLNALYYRRIQPTDARLYNLDERTYKSMQRKQGKDGARAFLQSETCILHYNGRYKPWKAGYKGALLSYYPKDGVINASLQIKKPLT